jgi:hypothetical protein
MLPGLSTLVGIATWVGFILCIGALKILVRIVLLGHCLKRAPMIIEEVCVMKFNVMICINIDGNIFRQENQN